MNPKAYEPTIEEFFLFDDDDLLCINCDLIPCDRISNSCLINATNSQIPVDLLVTSVL